MDRSYNTPSKCEICVNFVRITQKESQILQPVISNLDPYRRKVIGACLKPRREPRLLIRHFIFESREDCALFERRYYKESLDIPCPQCNRGQISITRPIINEQPVIIFGCSCYPDCRYTTRQIQLAVKCRYCGAQLILTGGDILKCTCPKCNRALSIPVSLRTWPGLVKPDGGCVHFSDEENCSLCKISRDERKSLLDLEVPTLKMWNEYSDDANSISRVRPNSDYELGEQFTQPYIDEDYLDVVEDYENFVNDYHSLLQEDDTGWDDD